MNTLSRLFADVSKPVRADISVDQPFHGGSHSVRSDIVGQRDEDAAPLGLEFVSGDDSTNMPRLRREVLVCLCILHSAFCFPAFAQTTTFTFQGQLASGGSNANGSYDMTFAVWDANVAGNFIAGPVTNNAVAVSNGLFTVPLDFGSGVFTGTNCWVQMGVHTNGGAGFATLVPRQPLTPTPYALYAAQSAQATSLSAQSPQFYSLCPPGSIMAYVGTSAPLGWLMCDGAPYSTNTYAALYAVIGNAYGAGGGQFNVPDMRGVFVRGSDNGRGYDPGRVHGSYQADLFASHNHGGSTGVVNNQVGTDPGRDYNNSAGISGSGINYTSFPNVNNRFLAHTHQIPLDGGTETRPKNISVNYIIKF